MQIRTPLLMLALGALLLAACGNEERAADCERGTLVAYGAGDWCVVIEEGFLTTDCPDDFPEGRAFGDAVVCGDSEAPDEMLDTLVAEGLSEAVCQDDPELGLVYVALGEDCQVVDYMCPEGDEAFSDACGCGCRYVGVCTEGETRDADCNSCTCSDGEWLCTTMACEECAEGDTRMEDCNTCTCTDGGWSCTEMACDECTDGETRMEDCNTCTCSGGIWACTGLACEECSEGETRVEGCESCTCQDGAWACDADMFCEYDACIAACPAACDPVEERICGDDLTYHCTPCHMACEGVSETNATFCADPAATCEATPPPDSVEVVWSVLSSEGCDEQLFEFGEPVIYAEADAITDAHPCLDVSGVDWDANRVARVVVNERTEAEVLAVWSRSDEMYVQTAAPAYCGGAAPPNWQAFLLIPVDGPAAIRQGDCTYGRCTGPPAP